MLAPGEPSENIEFTTVDGVFIKALKFNKKGDVMLQHKHTYSHAHFVAAGEVALFVEGEFVDTYEAPTMVNIEANKFHQIVALRDGTMGLCIHNLHGQDELSVEEEASYEKVA